MKLCESLHEDPSIRVLLWCLHDAGELSADSLRECGLTRTEADALIRDESGLLRRLKQRAALATRLTVERLAKLIRNRLAYHLENTQKQSELACLLRSLRGLPDWLFPEWQQGNERNLESLLSLGGPVAIRS
ncbi:MAG: hypothetical protein R3F46_04000 [bacterium]